MMRWVSRGLVVCMLTSLPAPVFADIAFPEVDVAAYCRMIMDSNPASKTAPGLLESCVSTDLEVRDEARARWEAAKPAIRQECLQLGRLNGQYSYQHILACIRYLEQRA